MRFDNRRCRGSCEALIQGGRGNGKRASREATVLHQRLPLLQHEICAKGLQHRHSHVVSSGNVLKTARIES